MKEGSNERSLDWLCSRSLSRLKKAQSYLDLQKILGRRIPISRVLYRNLASFEKADLIHSIADDSGMNKYAFFGSSPSNGKQHPHFVS